MNNVLIANANGRALSLILMSVWEPPFCFVAEQQRRWEEAQALAGERGEAVHVEQAIPVAADSEEQIAPHALVRKRGPALVALMCGAPPVGVATWIFWCDEHFAMPTTHPPPHCS